MVLINHCKLGLLSTCMKADNPIMQRVCNFANPIIGINKSKNQYCIHLRKDMDNHCDSAGAQQHKRDGDKRAAEPLTEVEVFDVRDNKTYPTY